MHIYVCPCACVYSSYSKHTIIHVCIACIQVEHVIKSGLSSVNIVPVCANVCVIQISISACVHVCVYAHSVMYVYMHQSQFQSVFWKKDHNCEFKDKLASTSFSFSSSCFCFSAASICACLLAAALLASFSAPCSCLRSCSAERSSLSSRELLTVSVSSWLAKARGCCLRMSSDVNLLTGDYNNVLFFQIGAHNPITNKTKHSQNKLPWTHTH